MMRMDHAGAFLVVEGVTDMRFWRPRKWAECELVDGEGKKNVIGGVKRLNAESFGGVLGIVDDDCDSLMNGDIGTRNIVRTDVHDLECLLCRSSALEKVLAEYGDESKIRRFETNAGVDVRSALLERALVFGRLRFAALRNGLDIDHSRIRVPRFVDAATWTVDGEGLIRAVVKDGSPCDEDVVGRCIAQLPVVDPWRVVRGHDMVSILRIGLGRILGKVEAGGRGQAHFRNSPFRFFYSRFARDDLVDVHAGMGGGESSISSSSGLRRRVRCSRTSSAGHLT